MSRVQDFGLGSFGNLSRSLANRRRPVYFRCQGNFVLQGLKFEVFAVLGTVQIILQALSNLKHFNIKNAWNKGGGFQNINHSSSGCDAVMRVVFFGDIDNGLVNSRKRNRVGFEFYLEFDCSFQQIREEDFGTIFDGLKHKFRTSDKSFTELTLMTY